MSLPHALLTALAEKPGSGLELTRRFDKSIGFFWSATHQQIYRELKRLEEQGWIVSEAIPSTRGQKREYKLLPAGRDELGRWARIEDQPTPFRESLMVRLRAEAALGPLGIEDNLRQRLDIHRRNLAGYLAIERHDFAEGDASRDVALQHLILTSGIRIEQGWIELLERALTIIAD